MLENTYPSGNGWAFKFDDDDDEYDGAAKVV
jgi:hypothetical protein